MISKDNYYKIIENYQKEDLPVSLWRSYDFVDKISKNGSSWKTYLDSEIIKKTIDKYFGKLDAFIRKNSTKDTSKQQVVVKEPKATKAVNRKTKKITAKKKHSKDFQNIVPESPLQVTESKSVPVVSEEVKLIKRYALMHNKIKTWNQIRLFLNAVQKAMVEQKIKKTTRFSEHISNIHKTLKNLLGKLSQEERVKIAINADDLAKYQQVAGMEKQMLSVQLIKSYITLQARPATHEKAKKLYNRVASAINDEKIKDSDPYFSKLMVIMSSLKSFVSSLVKTSAIPIHNGELSGMHAVVRKCLGAGLSGFTDSSFSHQSGSISSNRKLRHRATGKQIAAMQFPKMGFTGKFLELMGDPSRGFRLMISALPKDGKSFLSCDFADFLVQNFASKYGRVLYIAAEEKISSTLKEKIMHGQGLQTDQITFVDSIPHDIGDFGFVFFDSVNDANLSVEQATTLEKKYPHISWVYILQSTKDGDFRGSQQWAHNADMVIQFPERGLANQKGRYKAFGELRTFWPKDE